MAFQFTTKLRVSNKHPKLVTSKIDDEEMTEGENMVRGELRRKGIDSTNMVDTDDFFYLLRRAANFAILGVLQENGKITFQSREITGSPVGGTFGTPDGSTRQDMFSYWRRGTVKNFHQRMIEEIEAYCMAVTPADETSAPLWGVTDNMNPDENEMYDGDIKDWVG